MWQITLWASPTAPRFLPKVATITGQLGTITETAPLAVTVM
jgi:hypothetical protein